ncbi:hypothetical protein FPK06_03800 [Mycobacterium tuberculosis]|nr:hypothetical protein [Mycobacterium tuberculosis]QOM49548.1 hypothetical protein FPK06_03800 [Mycobacterium tuberculosis]
MNFKAEIVALQGWDRTRPCGRWSYARPDANLAQGNLNSMPQITASAKSPLARVQRRAAGCYRHLTRH